LTHLVAASSGPDAELADRLDQQAVQHRVAGRLHAAAETLLDGVRLSRHPGDAQRRLLDAVELLLLAGDAAAAQAFAPRIDALPADAHRLHVQARLAWLTGRRTGQRRRGDCLVQLQVAGDHACLLAFEG
jgi:hypothetical protein